MNGMGGNFEFGLGWLLAGAKIRKSAAGFMAQSAALGAVIFIFVLFYGLFIVRSEKVAALSIPAFFIPGTLWYFYALYIVERRKKRIEDEVPDMLLLASSMPFGAGAQGVIGFMASTSNGPLAEEFRVANAQIQNGMPVHEALELMKRRNNSMPLARALDLIISALRTGAEMNVIFRETAEDFMETNSILRERGAGMTVQKYTLLLAGGIVVPLVLGLVSGMVIGMDFSSISELGIGMTQKQRAALEGASMLSGILYIVEYALFASVFVGFQEGNEKKAAVYAAILVPLGAMVYFIGRGL